MNLAKPSGISLKEHTENVISQAKEWIGLRKQSLEKYERIFGVNVNASLLRVCKYHDLGKKMSAWQNACKADFMYSQKHGKIVGQNLQQAKIRHEIHSVLLCNQNELGLSKEERTAIVSHHGKLSSMHEEKWTKWQNGAGLQLWKEFKSLDFELTTTKNSFDEIVKKGFKFDFLRAGLQLADKRASAIENGASVPTRFKYDYNFNPGWKLRPVQEIAVENATDLFLLLRAPTGAGKTDACLLWAKQQIEVLNRADRLVIAMPTRFTSNALGINVSSSLSQTGVYHSTAKFLNEEGIEGNHFASLLETPATVCTIDHLLYCLSKTKEDHHIMFANLANSCVVFDEADFYDEFTQQNLLVLLEVLRILEVPVLLMSASLPNSSIDFYKQSGYQIDKIYEDDSDLERTRCSITEIREYQEFEEIEDLLIRATNQPTIIYVNTVDKALKLGKWFAKQFKEIQVEIYHSRFTESDKIKKEGSLITMLGKEAWENDSAHGIAILTQIGEMSVNISSDFMISEICPIDRLTQRIGRLARFHLNGGDLVVLKPQKKGKWYPAPYGNFDRKNRAWLPSKALSETVNILDTTTYSARDLNTLVNDVYKDGVNTTDKSITNASKLRKMIKDFWLILPGYELDEEQESGHWKTRDISGQTTILAIQKDEMESIYFENWSDLSQIVHENGINCPTYLVKANLKAGRIVKDFVLLKGEKQELIFITPFLKYNYIYGCDLSIPQEDIGDQFL